MTLETKYAENKIIIEDLNGISCHEYYKDNNRIESWYKLGYFPKDDYYDVMKDRAYFYMTKEHSDLFKDRFKEEKPTWNL